MDYTLEQKLKYSAGCTSKLHNGILSQTLSGGRVIDGLVCFEPVTWEKNKSYEFRCDVEAPKTAIAYLQVKLYQNGKEIRRINSRLNNQLKASLSLEVIPDKSDKMELLYRIIRREENLGKTVRWKNFYFGTPQPQKKLTANLEPAPRVEIIPGYQVCSIYLNGCKAEDYTNISGQIYYRAKGAKAWQPALAPAYIRHEKSLRGSLLNLRENTDYEVKLTVEDGGGKEKIIRSFQTKNAFVPVAKTIVLGPERATALLKAESGSATGYIRYTASPGFVLAAGKKNVDAVLLENCSYIILDGLTIRGGQKNGIMIRNSHHIQIINCDIAAYGLKGVFRPDLDGKHYLGNRAIWRDAGIHVLDCDDVLIERNYIHDPDSLGNSWFYSHPSGPNGICVNNSSSLTVRYNDIIGSDSKRWDDCVGSRSNFTNNGGAKRDAEICGNYFAFGNDDGCELDGGQMNARFFHNRVEGCFCGVSLAACMRGPSYVFQNRFINPGDEYDLGGSCIKMISGIKCLWGTVFLLNNDISWIPGNDISFPPLPEQQSPLFLLYARGNRYSSSEPYRLEEMKSFRFDINEKRSAQAFLPAMPKEFPGRPAGFSIKKSTVNFEQTDNAVRSEQVTLSATRPGFKSEFRVVQPEATRHFRVQPSSGILQYGNPVVLMVSSCPDNISIARRNTGAFAVRLNNGFSRPVSVTTDSRRNPVLLHAARSKAVFGKTLKNSDDSIVVEFILPKAGSYYLFVKNGKRKSTLAEVSCDDGVGEACSLTKPLYSGTESWHCLKRRSGKQKNHPYALSAGKHTFIIKPYKNYKHPDYTKCALTDDPDAFRLAPDDL